jgi:hypothetical protein
VQTPLPRPINDRQDTVWFVADEHAAVRMNMLVPKSAMQIQLRRLRVAKLANHLYERAPTRKRYVLLFSYVQDSCGLEQKKRGFALSLAGGFPPVG